MESKKKFPSDEKFGLVSQMRRAAVSVNSNLMEGAARNSNAEFKKFICIARGSVSELIYQIMLTDRLGFVDKEETDLLLADARKIARMLNGLLSKIT